MSTEIRPGQIWWWRPQGATYLAFVIDVDLVNRRVTSIYVVVDDPDKRYGFHRCDGKGRTHVDYDVITRKHVWKQADIYELFCG